MLPRCRRTRRFDDVFGGKVYLQGNLSGKQDKLPVLSEKREFLQAEIAAMSPLALKKKPVCEIIASMGAVGPCIVARTYLSPQDYKRGRPVSTVTDMCPRCPVLRWSAGLIVSSTSCPSIVRNSIKRPTDTDTGRQRISVDTCACVVPNNFAASLCVRFRSFRS